MKVVNSVSARNFSEQTKDTDKDKEEEEEFEEMEIKLISEHAVATFKENIFREV